MIRIVLEGDPIAKTRHRCGCRGKFPVAYDPQVKKEMEPVKKAIGDIWNRILHKAVSTEDRQEAQSLSRSDNFEVIMEFYMPLNKSDNLGQINLKLWDIIPCNDKPDFDNLAKFYADCATGIIWPDDKMIVCATVHKVRYSKNPRTEIVIMSKKELTLDERQMSVFKAFSPEDMKEFIMQAKQLSFLLEEYEYNFRETNNVPGEPFLSEASMLLINFSERFADKMKKISKLRAA